MLAPISADSNAYAWSNAIIEKFEASGAAIDQDVSGDDRAAARNTVDTTLALADASQRVCWDFVREDCRLWLANAADDGTCAIDVAPLRIDAVGVDPDWPTVREKLLNDGDPDRGADWSFWVDWYDKILGGDPQDWDMLHEIAVSDGIDWQASPRAVTAAIARIVQKHRLLNEIGDLKSQLDQFRASAEVRSHNTPPELLEDILEETQSIQIIWDQLVEVEDQLNKSAPDPSKLHKIGTVLRNTVTVVAKYSVHKTDEMVTETVKKIGAVGGVVIVASYAEIIERVQAFGKSLLEFAKLILGG